MSAPPDPSPSARGLILDEERRVLGRASRLHWIHWAVVIASLFLTVGAWRVSAEQVEEKATLRFERQAGQVIDLIVDRMRSYADALQAGVAFVKATDAEVDAARWRRYASIIDIETKYEGINGIGIIKPVPLSERDAYIERERRTRPGFDIFPHHEQPELLPIVIVEPLAGNQQAIGLDMAHERNRYQALQKARATGEQRITGPIVLVQDAEHTPGFLFFAPYYEGGPYRTEAERIENFRGLVYAPFIVRKLMQGVLSEQRRLVRIRIRDGDEVLYDELSAAAEDRDEDPMFRATREVEMFGRTWTFDIETGQAFRTANASSQPLTILFGGLLIDGMLLLLFMSLANANRRAIEYADRMNRQVLDSHARLERANEELAQFNYRTSHDLVAPLRTISGLAGLAREDVDDGDLDEVREHIELIDGQARRLAALVNDLLLLYRSDHIEETAEPVRVRDLVQGITERLSWLISEYAVEVRVGTLEVEEVVAQPTRLQQVIENLVSNGIKYSAAREEGSYVEVRTRREDDQVVFEVEDNGLGIPDEYADKVFQMFARLGTGSAPGSGLGLYLVQKHVEYLGGHIEFTSDHEGTSFRVAIPGRADTHV